MQLERMASISNLVTAVLQKAPSSTKLSTTPTSILSKTTRIVPIDEHLKFTILEENRKDEEEEPSSPEILELTDGTIFDWSLLRMTRLFLSSIQRLILVEFQRISIRRQEDSVLDDVSVVRVNVLFQRAQNITKSSALFPF